VHARLAHYFVDVDVLECSEDVFLHRVLLFLVFGLLALKILFGCGLGVLFENVVGDALVLREEAADDVLMIVGGVRELDHLVDVHVQMVIFQRVLDDCHLRILQVTDVTSRSAGVVLQKVAKMLQLVIHIIGSREVAKE